jgi:glutamyl-tRNA synthetase
MDDLVIIKTDGNPSYNFANVVDDSNMEITHVIRGDDHINNTPRQIAIYAAMNLPLPQFAHLPMLLDENKKRLSKRHGAANILNFREEGILPEALLNYIAKLGWGYGDQEFFTLDELIEKFTLDRVNRAACSIDPDKLQWLAGKHMEAASTDCLAQLWLQRLVQQDILSSDRAAEVAEADWLKEALETLKPRCKSLSEMVERGRFYFEAPQEYEEKGAKKFLKPAILPALEELTERMAALDAPFQHAELEELFKDILEKHETKMLKLAQPVRLFLTGTTVSPGIFEIITVLGQDEALKRMNKGLEFMRKNVNAG